MINDWADIRLFERLPISKRLVVGYTTIGFISSKSFFYSKNFGLYVALTKTYLFPDNPYRFQYNLRIRWNNDNLPLGMIRQYKLIQWVFLDAYDGAVA